MKLNIHLVFHTPWMRTAFSALLSLMAAACIVLTLVSGVFAATPDLPAELKQGASGQMVLLDFHSPYCSACRMMQPHVDRLRVTTAGKVFYKQLDLNEPDNRKYMDTFGIVGTPTYVLYDHNGKALYRMEALISPSLLETQVLRHTGQLKTVDIPQGLQAAVPATPADAGSGVLHNLLLVTFESDACTDCKGMTPYLTGFEMAGQQGLSIMRVDADSADGQALLKALAIEKLPSYVLLDNTDGTKEVLHIVQSNIKPRDLWSVIRLFGEDGLNGSFLEGMEE